MTPFRSPSDLRRMLMALALVLALAPTGARSTMARETVDLFQPDIVGGREATPGEWPHQVAVLDAATADNLEAQYCGGTLIDPEWVLTAAHCVEAAGAWGESDRLLLPAMTPIRSGGSRPSS